MARGLVLEPRCAAMLKGMRGKAGADLAALEKMLVAVSHFVCQYADAIEELELNPVWVSTAGRGVMALDAVLVTNRPL
jgi:acetate---CoA ligase (ADP-forming)